MPDIIIPNDADGKQEYTIFEWAKFSDPASNFGLLEFIN